MPTIQGPYQIDACTVRNYRGVEVQLEAGIWNVFQGGTGLTSLSLVNGPEVLIPDSLFAKLTIDKVARPLRR